MIMIGKIKYLRVQLIAIKKKQINNRPWKIRKVLRELTVRDNQRYPQKLIKLKNWR
jgi:hypothetical protein